MKKNQSFFVICSAVKINLQQSQWHHVAVLCTRLFNVVWSNIKGTGETTQTKTHRTDKVKLVSTQIWKVLKINNYKESCEKKWYLQEWQQAAKHVQPHCSCLSRERKPTVIYTSLGKMKKTFIENSSYSHKNIAAKKENTAHRKQDKQFISKSVASGMRPRSCDPHRKAAFMPWRKIKRNSCYLFVHKMEILSGMHSLQ